MEMNFLVTLIIYQMDLDKDQMLKYLKMKQQVSERSGLD